MRRAERLFQIIQILRRNRAPVTADAMAVELETSKRSVYRDIAALIGQRAPIRGEAGVGYVLEAGYDMPPLMLTPDEIEAATHPNELPAIQRTVLRPALMRRGVGGDDSWGARTLPQYNLPTSGTLRFRFGFMGV